MLRFYSAQAPRPTGQPYGCSLRFACVIQFCLALYPLIEILDRFSECVEISLDFIDRYIKLNEQGFQRFFVIFLTGLFHFSTDFTQF